MIHLRYFVSRQARYPLWTADDGGYFPLTDFFFLNQYQKILHVYVTCVMMLIIKGHVSRAGSLQRNMLNTVLKLGIHSSCFDFSMFPILDFSELNEINSVVKRTVL